MMARLDRWLLIGRDLLLHLFAAGCLLVLVALPVVLAIILVVSLVRRWP